MMHGRMFLWTGLALVLLALCLTAGVSLGSAAIPAETVWSILANKLVPGTFEPNRMVTPSSGCTRMTSAFCPTICLVMVGLVKCLPNAHTRTQIFKQ